MQQYQVPQFITVEDKVIGPFTVKQFMYLGGGGALSFLVYKLFQPFFALPFAVLFMSFAAALAFLKIHEQPFPRVLKNAVFFMVRPRLYIWKKEVPKIKGGAPSPEKNAESIITGIPKMSESKLSDLAWSLDIKQREERTNIK